MAYFSLDKTYSWTEIRDRLADPHMTSYYVEYYFDQVGNNQYKPNKEAERVTPITNAVKEYVDRMHCLDIFDESSKRTWKAGVGWFYN